MIDKVCGKSNVPPKPHEISQEGDITSKEKLIKFLKEDPLELAVEERTVLDAICHTSGKHWLILSVRNCLGKSSC